MILVGNKADLEQHRQVSLPEQAASLMVHGISRPGEAFACV